MSNLVNDLQETIREKIKTAEQVNNSYRRSAGRSLRLKKSGETMAVYRRNKKSIEEAKAQYLTDSSSAGSAINE